MWLGFVGGCVRGNRILRDVPAVAMIGVGIVITAFCLFALVSYFGFLFYMPGLLITGFGMGSGIIRSWSRTDPSASNHLGE